MSEEPEEKPADRSDPPPPQPERPSTILSEDLFRGGREIRIQHAGEVYRLRLTRNGKLILHK